MDLLDAPLNFFLLRAWVSKVGLAILQQTGRLFGHRVPRMSVEPNLLRLQKFLERSLQERANMGNLFEHCNQIFDMMFREGEHNAKHLNDVGFIPLLK
jgi:hypothetical protein